MSDKDKKNATSFKPGQSGNPGGRSPRVGPNGETWTQLMRGYSPEAAERFKKLLFSTDDNVSLKAFGLWIPYAWGKPPEIDGNDKPDLASVLTDLIAKLPS